MSSAYDIFKLLDDDESGSISVEEFVIGCMGLRGEAKSFDLARLGYDLKRENKTIAQSVKKLEEMMQNLNMQRN